MAEVMIEKWSGAVATVTVGAKKEEGGTRTSVVKVGGQKTLPFLFAEGDIPHAPAVAFEIWDVAPVDWPDDVVKAYGDAVKDPCAWAKKCVRDFGAQMLCLKLQGSHPDMGNRSAEAQAKTVRDVLAAVGVPLIILGCGDDATDNRVLPAASEAAKGERCLIGDAVQDNYKTLTAAVLADGHNLVCESPIDINIAKQLNILVSDMGLSLERIVINPTIGALGYGLEYAYSIMERARLAALAGDKTLAAPFICLVGQEASRAKEARVSAKEFPAWGAQEPRSMIWEAVTAVALLQAGADILVMRHPQAIAKVQTHIKALMTR